MHKERVNINFSKKRAGYCSRSIKLLTHRNENIIISAETKIDSISILMILLNLKKERIIINKSNVILLAVKITARYMKPSPVGLGR